MAHLSPAGEPQLNGGICGRRATIAPTLCCTPAPARPSGKTSPWMENRASRAPNRTSGAHHPVRQAGALAAPAFNTPGRRSEHPPVSSQQKRRAVPCATRRRLPRGESYSTSTVLVEPSQDSGTSFSTPFVGLDPPGNIHPFVARLSTAAAFPTARTPRWPAVTAQPAVSAGPRNLHRSLTFRPLSTDRARDSPRHRWVV